MVIGCVDMFINDSFRSGFLGASIHENAHVNSCVYRPSCSLAAIDYPEVFDLRYTDVPAHLRNVEPNTSYLAEGVKRLHADSVTWNIYAYQFGIHHELTSLEISELASIVKGRSFASRLATDKTGNNVAMSDSEETALHPKYDDHLSRLITMTAEQSSIDDLISTLTKCRQLKDPLLARVTYVQTCCLGLDDHMELGNHLVPMFVDCGSLSAGQRVFNKLIMQTEHSWTSLIQGSIEWGDWKNASKLFEEMKGFLVHPSSFTFVALLKGCAIERLAESGQELHTEVTKQGRDIDPFVGNVLVDMYCKCGSLEEALKVFDDLPSQDVVSWNSLIAGYVDGGHYEEAISCYETMQEKGLPCDNLTFIFALKATNQMGASGKGQEIHAEIAREGYECSSNLGSTLVDMYAKYGLLLEAREVFDSILDRDAISWNPLIAAYAQHGLEVEALECLKDMKMEGFSPNAVAFSSCMQACDSSGAIRKGHEIHAECTKHGVERDPLIGSAVVDMYCKFGAICEAERVFNMLPTRDVVPWTALIGGYSDCGFGEEALNHLDQMQVEGIAANKATHVCSLKACTTIKAEEKGRYFHMVIAKEGLEKDPVIGSALVDMYAKCGSLPEASELLSKLPVRGVVVWTALIAGYIEEGLNQEALECLKQMQFEGVIPNAVTFLYGLKACGKLVSLSIGLELHAQIVSEEYELEPLVGTSLVDMYVKCGCLLEGREVFEKLQRQDVVAWNALIAGCFEQELFEEALNHLNQMHLEGVSANSVTYVLLLKACWTLQAIGRGQELFMQITKEGLEEDPYIASSLVDFFVKCGCLVEAREEVEKLPVRDVVSWTSLIAGYAEHGLIEAVFECTGKMNLEGLSTNADTFVCCLKACSNMKNVSKGYETHVEIVIRGFENDILIVNSLVDMYAKCGCLVEAQNVFDELQNQNVVTWTALIGGYAAYANESQAFECFQRMQLVGVSPDVMTWNNIILGFAEQGDCLQAYHVYQQMKEQAVLPNLVTFTNSLKACGSTAALNVGRRISAHIYGKAGSSEVEILLENAIVDMYGRCGSLAEAQQTFNAMPSRQLVTWNGLVTGYSRQGKSDAVFFLVSRMRDEGFQPNAVTLLGVLNACNHAGLVDEGKDYFNAMNLEYHLDGNIMHHNCVIDLLSRAGRFDDVWAWLQEMPIQPNLDSWITVLNACQTWGNVELGRYAFESLVKLDKSNKGAFIMMGNIYANANMWDEARKSSIVIVGEEAL